MVERACLSAPLVNTADTPSASGSEERVQQWNRLRASCVVAGGDLPTDAEGDEDESSVLRPVPQHYPGLTKPFS